MPVSAPILVFLIAAAFFAGFLDAAVGGGGLITIPALLVGLPNGTAMTTLLGTNKAVAATGATFATSQFLRAGILRGRELAGPIAASLLGAIGGVHAAYAFQGRFEAYCRPVMLFLLAAMLAFTLLRPEMGRHHAPRFGVHHQRGLATAIAAALGFYDGFFGPGTGAVLVFLFVSVLGFDFLRASALGKSVNWASNVTSLAIFLARGSWIPTVALSMAAANGLGGWWGARTALRRGSGWLRATFIVVVIALVVRLTVQVLSGR